jgi:Tfp pilus assembly protein PilF
MQKISLGLAVGLLLTALTACISTVPQEPTDPGAVSRENLPPAPSSDTPSASRSRAVADLVAGSQREYDRGDWQSSIAMAERALRIDRRQPDVYLLMAKSYRALGESQLALQFVNQGLRYIVDDETSVARELNWLADTLR